MSQFAFQVSWLDLIRKIGYRYEHPVDYVSALIGRMYDPGARVDITVDPITIEVRSDSMIRASLFDQALNGSPLESTFVIPPVIEYATVRILSGRRGIVVDGQRAIHRADPDAIHYGTIITIQRDQGQRKDGCWQDGNDAAMISRLERLYWGSDMRFTINGRALYSRTSSFNTGVFAGDISYDAGHEGGIRYYALGRFIEGEPFVDGVSVLVHRHPFRTTLTNSHIIKSRDEHLEMQRQLPNLMADYLESPHVRELAMRRPHSFRALYQATLARFPENERLRSLANRPAPPGAGRSLANRLAPPGARHSPDRLAASQPAGSTGRPSLSLKIVLLCTMTALCVGLWRHSEVDRPPAGAQSTLGPARLPVDSVSTSASPPDTAHPADAAHRAQVSAMAPGNIVSTPPSNPTPPRLSQGSVGVSGDGVGPQIRTGQDEYTPSASAVESAPGLAYGTSSALAEELKHWEEHASESGTSHEGYVPESTLNLLTLSGGHLEWGRQPPYDTLVDGVQHPVWSPAFSSVSGHADGIRAVRSYLDSFGYGSIPLDVGRRYTDDLSALLAERKADCTSSNTLAAHLLFQLGYRKVTAVIGTRGGCPHMWLSIWENDRWRIEDFTPARMSPDFAQACLAHSVTLPTGPDSQQPRIGSNGHRTSLIFFELCIILILFRLGRSIVASVLQARALHAADNWSPTAESVRDLLGLAAVHIGTQAAYDRRTRTLTIDGDRLSGDGPFVSAVKAVPLVGRDEVQQQALYRRLADRATR